MSFFNNAVLKVETSQSYTWLDILTCYRLFCFVVYS